MYNTIAFLGKQSYILNDLGEKEKRISFSSSFVYAEQKSVRSGEFYQAMQNGMKPEIVVVVNKYDYYDYEADAIRPFIKVEHPITCELIDYTIVRTYEPDRDKIELTLVRGIEHASA